MTRLRAVAARDSKQSYGDETDDAIHLRFAPSICLAVQNISITTSYKFQDVFYNYKKAGPNWLKLQVDEALTRARVKEVPRAGLIEC